MRTETPLKKSQECIGHKQLAPIFSTLKHVFYVTICFIVGLARVRKG
ncbi:hypothetical protein Lbys_1729 [Leadbetterella byssophila DSM 17132]|uniref:Uncharacterized protein n=1 Tax=Leadbetterella byssophila (strain DSM 17132 / JCM 16389 / KACC 11308 / NBRC 106382 / 4M15) TaxID=649349 RepID=E4RQ61_LEAB4|nr:hypothetical protein Lbys_1729 [Leadbetterella byssophila DSM 17132]